jgi:hypothetical protein|nr:CsgG/HfaB family protein [uncultured Limnobacter sp.]
MHAIFNKKIALILLAAFTATGCVTTGTNKTAVTGSSAGASSANANSGLERCDKSLGTIAMDDGREASWYREFGAATRITSIEPLLRLAVQQSNCFVITSKGNRRINQQMQDIMNEQRNSGETRAGSKLQKGQKIAADYYLIPEIVIDNDAVGKLSGLVGGFLGGSLGAVAGGMESKASVVTLSLFDMRAGIQIAAAEGSSTATNYGAAVGAFTGSAAGGLSGFSKTPEGKATVAAFIESYNNMVISLREYKAQDVEGGMGRGGVLKVN